MVNSKARGSSVDTLDKTAAFLRYTLSKRQKKSFSTFQAKALMLWLYRTFEITVSEKPESEILLN